MHRQAERADHRVVVNDRIAQDDRMHGVAGLSQHRADQRLAGRRNALEERRIQASFDFRVGLTRPRHRSAVAVRDQRVMEQRSRPSSSGNSTSAAALRIERAHPGMPRCRRCHRIRRLQVAIHVNDDGRRHRPGLGRELAHVFVVGQARAVANRQVDENRQDRDGEKNLASQRLGQCGSGLRANGISLS